MHEAFGARHGLRQREPGGERSRDGGRIRAARAVRVRRVDARGRELAPAGAVVEDIGGAAFQVPAFDQHGARAHFEDAAGGLPAWPRGRGFPTRVSASASGTLGVARAARGSKWSRTGADGGIRQQRGAVLADHDGVHHQREAEAGGGAGHGFHHFGRAQGSRLGRGGRNVLQHGLNLLFDQRGGHHHHARDAGGILHRHQGDHGLAVDSELVERLEVGLEARASARVGAGDGERNGGHSAPG